MNKSKTFFHFFQMLDIFEIFFPSKRGSSPRHHAAVTSNVHDNGQNHGLAARLAVQEFSDIVLDALFESHAVDIPALALEALGDGGGREEDRGREGLRGQLHDPEDEGGVRGRRGRGRHDAQGACELQEG